MKEGQKYQNLEGLRGLAALSVVFYHYILIFAPFLLAMAYTHRHTPIDRWLSSTPLGMPFNGIFAVCVFFVLSGFVLSLSFFKHMDREVLVSSAARRYFRLMIPAFGSVLLAYMLLRFGFLHPRSVAPITESWSLTQLWTIPAGVGSALYQGLYSVFFTDFTPLNSVLWTMHYELFGSFLVFLFLGLFGKLPNRWFFYMFVGLGFLKTYYLGFLLGVAICDLWVHYPALHRLKRRWHALMVLVTVACGGWASNAIYPNLYNRLHLPLFTAVELRILAFTVGAAALVFTALSLKPLARLLELRPLRYLGRVSFSLYLTHLLVLGAFSLPLFKYLYGHLGYGPSLLIMFPPSMLVTFGVATLYMRVDLSSITISKRIGTYLIGERTPLVAWRELRKRQAAPKPEQPVLNEPVLAPAEAAD